MNVLGRRAPRPQPGPSEGEHRRDPRLAAGARGCTDGGGWEPGRRPAEPSEPGAGEAAGCPPLRAAAASLPLAVLPRRAPVSALARTRPPAAVQLGVAAVPRRPRQPLFAPRPGPHSPPRRRSQHLPGRLSLPDWPSRDLMPISQSPPLAGPRLTSEQLAAAWGAGSGGRAEGVSASPASGAGYLSGSVCARAEHSKGRGALG